MPFNIHGYKVKQDISVDDHIARSGKCPRGHDFTCNECGHVRVVEDFGSFYCSDMNIDLFQITPFKTSDKGPYYVAFTVSYHDMIIIDLVSNCTDIREVPAATLTMNFLNFIDISDSIHMALRNLFTTGQITIEYHTDTGN